VTEEIITHSAEETTNWGKESPSALRLPFSCFSRAIWDGKDNVNQRHRFRARRANEDDVTSPTLPLFTCMASPPRLPRRFIPD